MQDGVFPAQGPVAGGAGPGLESAGRETADRGGFGGEIPAAEPVGLAGGFEREAGDVRRLRREGNRSVLIADTEAGSEFFQVAFEGEFEARGVRQDLEMQGLRGGVCGIEFEVILQGREVGCEPTPGFVERPLRGQGFQKFEVGLRDGEGSQGRDGRIPEPAGFPGGGRQDGLGGGIGQAEGQSDISRAGGGYGKGQPGGFGGKGEGLLFGTILQKKARVSCQGGEGCGDLGCPGKR